MKANVAWSTDENAFLAGKNSAKKAVLDLIQTKVAFIFSSVKYDAHKLIEGAKEELGTAPIIGCTSNGGVLVPDGYITSENGFVGIMAIGDPDTAVGVAGSPKMLTARETGRKVAIEAMNNVGTTFSPAYFFMIANPGEEEEYAKGIQDVIGDVPMFGGSCADDDLSGKWRIFTGDKVFSEGVAVAFFYTNKKLVNEYTGKYHETVNSGIITEIEGKRTLKEINNIPAMKQYAEWTGFKTRNLMGDKILTASILKPLGVKTPTGNVTLIRHPMAGNSDYSINVGNDLAVNTAVIQMQASLDELVNAPRLVLRNLKSKLSSEPAGYLLVHCGGRKIAIGDRIDEVAKLVKEEAGDVPFIMPFTFGEYGRAEHEANNMGGLMLSETAFCK